MIETERLVLRPWREADGPALAAINADRDVMEHLGGPLDRASSDAALRRQLAAHERLGCCFWAVGRRADAALLGLCGVRLGGVPGTPVDGVWEIGWRFARHA